MAKELPYYKEEPAEYLAGDISFCSLEAQGLFSVLKSYYWLRSCRLTKTQFLKRSNHEKEFNELVDNGIIDIENDKIIIKFMLFQLNEIQSVSKQKSLNGSKGGRPKKTEIKANQKLNESKQKAIREDKIKEDNIINDSLFSIEDLRLKYLDDKVLLNAFCKGQNTNINFITKKLDEFNLQLASDGIKIKTWHNYTTHFRNWFKKNKEFEVKSKKIDLGI